MEQVEVSLILPMCNEADSIENCVFEARNALESFSHSYEIIIAEDGSTDNTYEKARMLTVLDKKISHLHSNSRLGKGEALKRAIGKARGQVVCYVDADSGISLANLKDLVETARNVGGMSIGSRLVHGSIVRRRFLRKLLSRCYNLMVRALFHDGVHDHQCGFKAFTASLLDNIQAEDSDWFWDTEMIVRAKRRGFAIKEISVSCSDMRGPEGSKVRLFSDAIRMWQAAFKLRLKITRNQKGMISSRAGRF